MNEIMPFAATLMDLERVKLSESSQTEKPCDITCTQNLEHDTNEFIYETEKTHRHKEQNCGFQRAWGV